MRYHVFIERSLFENIQRGVTHSIAIRYRPAIKTGDEIVLHEKRVQSSRDVTTITNNEFSITAKEVLNKGFTTRRRRKTIIAF